MTPAKEKNKIQKRLSELNAERFTLGKGGCWVCEGYVGLSTCRSASGKRCKACFEAGKTNPKVEEHDRLLARLSTLNSRRAA